MKSEIIEEKPKKLKKPKSVNLVLWRNFCLFAVLIICLVEAVFYFVVSGTFESKARLSLERIGPEVTVEIAKGTADLQQRIMRYYKEGITVYVFTEKGNVIIPDIPELADAESDGGRFSEMKSRLENVETGYNIIYRYGNALNYATVVPFDNIRYRGPGYVLVTYSLSVIKETVSNIQLYLLLIGISAMALALLVSFAVSKKLTGGLKTMSDTALELAKGNYAANFTNTDYKELARLSATLNHMRDEVKKSEDFQHEILANVTHDLKTPLTMIKAYASMVKEISGDNPEKREKHLQVIIDEADRLTGLVNDVLSVSKLQSHIDAINPKVFNLTELVYGIINKFGYLQESQGYSFMVDIDSGIYTRADEEKIRQVIYNLLGNAANYTGEDKTVYISLKSSMDGQRAEFSVRDTGKGIAGEDLPEIWNRYYRVKENHQRPVKGTGLGLNIVKVILENHSFEFGVKSERGKGSTFWVDFPSVPLENE